MRSEQYIGKTAAGVTRYPLHRHDFCEIMLYERGNGVLHTDRGDYPFSPGCAILVPAGVLHGSAAADGFSNISVGVPEGGLLPREITVITATSEDSHALARMIYENRFFGDAYLSSLVTAYTLSLLRQRGEGSAAEQAVRRVVALAFAEGLRPDFDMAAALRASGYAEDYLRACFRRLTGKTPLSFLQEVRVRAACRRMEIYGRCLSVGELAEQCGYADPVYFSRVFRKVTGQSPRAYARAHRK